MFTNYKTYAYACEFLREGKWDKYAEEGQWCFFGEDGFVLFFDDNDLENFVQEMVDAEELDLKWVERIFDTRGTFDKCETEVVEGDENLVFDECGLNPDESCWELYKNHFVGRDVYIFKTQIGKIRITFPEYDLDEFEYVVLPNRNFKAKRHDDLWRLVRQGIVEFDDIRRWISWVDRKPCTEGLIVTASAFFNDRQTFIENLERYGYASGIERIMKHISKKLNEQN